MRKMRFMILGAFLIAWGGSFAAVRGTVTDLNGLPVGQVMVTLTKSAGVAGATATTVFSSSKGEFAFPPDVPPGTLTVRALDYKQVGAEIPTAADPIAILVRPSADQSGVAPASAYLKDMKDADTREAVIMACVVCHQVPAPEVRAYARLLDDTPSTQNESAREQAWTAIVSQMDYITTIMFADAAATAGPVSPGENLALGLDPRVRGKWLARTLRGPMREVHGYQYGAPLIATSATSIREFEVPGPNAIREAVPSDGGKYLYVADVSSNRLIRIDTRSAAIKDYVIPGSAPRLPHTLVPGRDGIWVGPFAPGALMRFDPRSGAWKIWPLAKVGNEAAGLHDISFDANHELVTDRRYGRIWFSDILNNGVGWLDPKTGASGEFKVPPVPGRTGPEQIYGLVMGPDRVHVWYCQLGIASCGSFNIETLKFETHIEFDDKNAGPRRISMSDSGTLYIALYGAGQLAAYDTNAKRMVGIFDLPDRASAPYATFWDPIRKVVWITTSNADAIYRFDPRARTFGVLPLPRERCFLRMLHVDRRSGMLATSCANVVQHVRGPRMALLIDPGDRATETAAGVSGRTAHAGVTQ